MIGKLLSLSKLDLALYGCAALLVLVLAGMVMKWKHDSGVLKVERAEHKAAVGTLKREHQVELDRAHEATAIAIENARLQREISSGYQKRLAQLEADRARTPARAVRLCIEPGSVSATATGPHAAGGEGLPEAPGRDPRVSRDIGPDLYALADEADRCAAQRDALIEGWTRVSAP